MARITFDPATADHSTPKFTVGAIYEGADGKAYKYVRFHDIAAVAIAPGTVVQFDGDEEGSVTADISASADATHNRAAGIAVSTPSTEAYYGFIQVRGFCSLITTDGNVAKGDFLVSGADGVADPYAISDTPFTSGANADAGRIFGQALAADSSTSLTSAQIWCA